jgi:hypothetical protein
MTLTEFYEAHLQKLRNELIQEIINFVKNRKANELSLNNAVVVNSIDDQISETVDIIKADGDVIIGVTFNEDYESDLTELHNDILLSILRELEEGNFEVVEEDGSEEE